MPQDAFFLKRRAVANGLSLNNYGEKWAEFAGLADAFAEKRGAIIGHRFLQNLDIADQAWLLWSGARSEFQPT